MALLTCYETKAELLVSLKYEELEEIFICISHSKNQTLCNEIKLNCDFKLPKKVFDADQACDKEQNPDQNKICNCKTNLYPSDDIFPKVFQCINDRVNSLTDDEKKQMKKFEDCVSALGKACKALPKNQ
ncbi:hypothetical protein JTE90_022448 [Oedothorax gibbosus]|uniref:Uncharacterized protein n=1 Tax=Oedothorax gibbosus TaxID=931172 RepID=A0AAV6TWF6_9ARAC|nr:hypothetical protein JTE90_022448 [Oedothorax gibbosus]